MTSITYYNRFMLSAALAAVLSGNVFADVLYSDPSAYFNMVRPSLWALTGDYNGGLTPTTFNLQNVNSNNVTTIAMYSLQGTTSYLGVNGNKILYNADPSWSGIHTPYAGGIGLSAMAAIDSFYFKVGALTDPNKVLPPNVGLPSHVTLTATDSFGIEWVMHQLISEDMFFGLILDEGYFTNVSWYFSDGTDDVMLYFTPDLNAPYQPDFYGVWQYYEFGLGDGTIGVKAAVPEPATLLIAGMGIAGLAATRRLRKK